jgi:hypothetical protein
MASVHCFICAVACAIGTAARPPHLLFSTRIRIVSGTRGLAGIVANDLLLLDLMSPQQ